MKRLFLASLIILFLLNSSKALAKIGAPDETIKLGMSTALTGPAGKLGCEVQSGVFAALTEINNHGGIQNKTLKLITLDDSYEPIKTSKNIRSLIDEHNVVCLIGNVGTPTAVAALPIINTNKILYFGAYSGAEILRNKPPDRYVINFRASYAQETSEMVEKLISEGQIRPDEIALFSQRDAYGTAGCLGALDTLKKYDPEIRNKIVDSKYYRNTLAVEKALTSMMLHEPTPKAVIMIGAYAPCAELVRLARKYDYNPVFLNVSFVGTTALSELLGEKGNDVIITQVVPHYEMTDLPIIKQYRDAVQVIGEEPSFASLEGYISTRILIRALLQIKGSIDRESVVDALEGLGSFTIGIGEELNLTSENHQACDTIWPTIIKNQQVVQFDWNNIGDLLRQNDE